MHICRHLIQQTHFSSIPTVLMPAIMSDALKAALFAAQKAAYIIIIIFLPLLLRSGIYGLRQVSRQANRCLRKITDMYSHQCQSWLFEFKFSMARATLLTWVSCSTRGFSPSANLSLKLRFIPCLAPPTRGGDFAVHRCFFGHLPVHLSAGSVDVGRVRMPYLEI